MGLFKDDAPAPPDYSALIATGQQQAATSLALGQSQLAWAKEQYASDKQTIQPIIDENLARMKKSDQWADEDRARYQGVFQPVEDTLVAQAKNYASGAKQQENANKAASQVAQQFQGARTGAQARMAALGVDPSQMRSTALDSQSRIAQAAATAGAATQAEIATEGQGQALMGQVSNLGRGYPSQTIANQGVALNSGAQGTSSALQLTASGANTMGTGLGWTGSGLSALGTAGNLMNTQYSNQLSTFQANQNASSGIGGLLGMGLGMLTSDENAKEDMREVGQTHDGQPLYSYTYKDDPNDTPQIGLKAQDVEKRDPGAVVMQPNGLKAVHMGRALAGAHAMGEGGGAAPGRDTANSGDVAQAMGRGRYVDPAMSPSGGQHQDDVQAYVDGGQGMTPLKVNAGEYIVPADVVSYLGHSKFDKMVQQARMNRQGLSKTKKAA
jgi:hypothetical protein